MANILQMTLQWDFPGFYWKLFHTGNQRNYKRQCACNIQRRAKPLKEKNEHEGGFFFLVLFLLLLFVFLKTLLENDRPQLVVLNSLSDRSMEGHRGGRGLILTCFELSEADIQCARLSAWCSWPRTRRSCQGTAPGGWCVRAVPQHTMQTGRSKWEWSATWLHLKGHNAAVCHQQAPTSCALMLFITKTNLPLTFRSCPALFVMYNNWPRQALQWCKSPAAVRTLGWTRLPLSLKSPKVGRRKASPPLKMPQPVKSFISYSFNTFLLLHSLWSSPMRQTQAISIQICVEYKYCTSLTWRGFQTNILKIDHVLHCNSHMMCIVCVN